MKTSSDSVNGTGPVNIQFHDKNGKKLLIDQNRAPLTTRPTLQIQPQRPNS
jgi:hypothetical protein